MKDISKGVRIVNYGIDISLIWIFSVLCYTLFNRAINYNLIFYLAFFCYYLIFESLSGQTLGKMVTKTKVVNMNNDKPGVGRIFYRTLLRLNPFDSFSYIFGQEQGGHDLISRTRLIQKD